MGGTAPSSLQLISPQQPKKSRKLQKPTTTDYNKHHHYNFYNNLRTWSPQPIAHQVLKMSKTQQKKKKKKSSHDCSLPVSKL
jgi:hypothetical protein